MKQKINILLAEDDDSLRILIKDYLNMIGYNVIDCKDGKEALAMYKKTKPSLLLLDVMMPKIDGFSLVEEIRKKDVETPIIFITARSLQEDKIFGFKIGCDDYLVKPFSSEELSLRIGALLKRCKQPVNESKAKQIKLGEISFYPEERLIGTDSFRHTLTRKEADLLFYLAKNKNGLLTRKDILREVWKDDNYFAGRSMDVFITRLRKYLKGDPLVNIVNVHGTGFRLEVKE